MSWGKATKRLAAAGLTAAVVAALAPAVAPETVAAAPDATLSANPSSMWQTNNDVDALAVGNGVLYAGGRFTSVRPPGAAQGTNEVSRSYIAAFNANTGALITTWNVTLNGRVRALRLSPNGSRLYVGGDFTTVNNVTRQRLVSLVASTGAVDTSFTANANARVTTIAVNAGGLYVGGDFTTIKGVARTRVAKLNPTNGNVDTSFVASVDGRPRASALAPDGSRYFIGGGFQTVNGTLYGAMASLDPTTGAIMPWASIGIVGRIATGGGCDSDVTDIVVQGTRAYVTAEGNEPGCYEGAYAANIADGSLIWDWQCLGASQALAIVGDVLYRGSHMHDCGRTPGGFVGPRSPNDFVWYRLQGHSLSDGSFVHWSPNTNGAGQDHVGPHVMATDGTQLFVGGDFTRVNNTAQRGLTRFGPNGGNSTPAVPAAPSVTASAPGTATIVVRGVADNNHGHLTYMLYRDGGTTPIATRVVESWPWSLPTLRFDDTGLPAGSAHTYRVRVSDGTGTSGYSPASAPVTISGSAPPAFASAVQGVAPGTYWELNEATGPLAGSSASAAGGIAVGGVTQGVPGAVDGGTGVRLDGTTGYLTANDPTTHGAAFTQSAFFKTTTRVGGTIMAFSADQTGLGAPEGTDRVVFMENDGKLAFALRAPSGRRTRFAFTRTATTFNDGAWHHVVATFDGLTLSLYVDGELHGTAETTNAALPGPSHLRAGFANLSDFYLVFGRNASNIPAPTSYSFAGDLDEIATFPVALSAGQVQALWQSGAAGLLAVAPPPPPPPPPPADYAATVLADAPALYWRLAETGAGAVADSSGNGTAGTYRAGLTYGVTGAPASGGNPAVQSPGTSGVAYTTAAAAAPGTYSVELWFRTTSTRGGKLIGYEDVPTGWGASYDRHVYMTNAGRLTYGVVSGGVRRTVQTSGTYNDGAWHHVVATQGASGMNLYVDGALVGSLPGVTTVDPYSGHWRVGGGRLTSWLDAPTSAALTATFDEVAVYPTVLGADRVAAHFAAAS